MKKDAYYFPHYSNARNDSKVIKLRRVLGLEGYGIYFMLLEILREQTAFKLSISSLEDLAYEWHTSKEKVISVINDYGLFTIEGDVFYSLNLINYLQPYLEKSQRARDAANKRWSNAKAYANALPQQCEGNADQNASKVKESKVEESRGKEKEAIIIPSVANKGNILLEKEQLKTELLNSYQWIEQSSKLLKTPIQKIKDYMVQFVEEQTLKEEIDRPLKEIRNHFFNYLKIEINKNKPKEYNNDPLAKFKDGSETFKA